MSAAAGLARWPLARLASRPAAARLLFASAGATSFALGIVWAVPPIQRLLA